MLQFAGCMTAAERLGYLLRVKTFLTFAVLDNRFHWRRAAKSQNGSINL